MEDFKTDDRKQFMKPHFADPLKKREEFSVTLRKKKHQEIIHAKRRRMLDEIEKGEECKSSQEELTKKQEQRKKNMKVIEELCGAQVLEKSIAEQIDVYIQKINDVNDLEKQIKLVEQVRILLSTSNKDITSIIQRILDQNKLVPLTLQIMGNSQENEDILNLKFEALWILSNLAFTSDNLLQKVLENNQQMIEIPARFLSDKYSQRYLLQALWYYGNLTAENPQIRSQVLKKIKLSTFCLKQVCTKGINLECIQVACWVNHNIAKEKCPLQPHWEQIFQTAQIGLMTEDLDVIYNSLGALSCISDTDDEKFFQVASQGELIAKILSFIHKDQEIHLISSALKIIGNLFSSSTDLIFDKARFEGVLIKLVMVLRACTNYTNVILEALWSLSNLAAHSEVQIEYMATDQGGEVVELLLDLSQCRENRIVQEAIWALVNMITGATFEILEMLFQRHKEKLLESLKYGLKLMYNNQSLVINIFESFEALLKLEHYLYQNEQLQSKDYMRSMFTKVGLLDLIENFQRHPNMKVYEKATEILTKYFEAEESDMVPMNQHVQSVNQNPSQRFNI